MFKCEECAPEQFAPYKFKSYGNCEVCGRIRECVDVTTSCHGKVTE